MKRYYVHVFDIHDKDYSEIKDWIAVIKYDEIKKWIKKLKRIALEIKVIEPGDSSKKLNELFGEIYKI